MVSTLEPNKKTPNKKSFKNNNVYESNSFVVVDTCASQYN